MYGPPKFRRVIQYIWDPEPQNTDHEHEIVCLGKVYSPISKATQLNDNESNDNSSNSNTTPETINTQQSSISLKDQQLNSSEWPQEFLDDVDSKLWFTYRTNFPVIPCSRDGPSSVSIGRFFRGSGIDLNGFTSDVGWGCMIRTSQSLLANCILMIQLGRDWRRPSLSKSCSLSSSQNLNTDIDDAESTNTISSVLDKKEVDIVSMFADNPNSLFSVHNFVKHGEAACGKKPGEWFGPSAAASSIKALHQQKLVYEQEHPNESSKVPLSDTSSYKECFRVFISSGSDVYEKTFMQTAIDSDGVFHPTLILLGLRLGIDKVNEVYWDGLKEYFASPQAVGIAGGRPSSSHYFYGYQGDNLFYLDPHHPKAALNPNEMTAEAIETVHTRRIRCLQLSELDPSMLMGVLIKSEQDWKSWKDNVKKSAMQSIIHISWEPIDIRRSSVSISNDDDFIDVMLETGSFGEDDILPEDNGVMAHDSRDTTLGIDMELHDPETAVMVDKESCNNDPSVASILDISKNFSGKIRTQSISGLDGSSPFYGPETPSIEKIEDRGVLQLENSMLSLATESGINSEIIPSSPSKFDNTATPIYTSPHTQPTAMIDTKNNGIEFALHQDDPILVEKSAYNSLTYTDSSEHPSEASSVYRQHNTKNVNSNSSAISSGEELEHYEDEEALSILDSDVVSGTDSMEIRHSNFKSTDPVKIASVSSEGNFALSVKNIRKTLHRDSDSSYHDVGEDEYNPIAAIKSKCLENGQLERGKPNDEAVVNDTETIEPELGKKAREASLSKPISESDCKNDLSTSSVLICSGSLDSIPATLDTSFSQDDGFHDVSASHYDSVSLSTYNIVERNTDQVSESSFLSPIVESTDANFEHVNNQQPGSLTKTNGANAVVTKENNGQDKNDTVSNSNFSRHQSADSCLKNGFDSVGKVDGSPNDSPIISRSSVHQSGTSEDKGNSSLSQHSTESWEYA